MNDKKTITVEIPVLDNVDQMKVVETFTEEQLWYVCAIAKAFEKKQSNWNSLREWLEEQIKHYSTIDCQKEVKYEFLRIADKFTKVLDKMNELEGEE